MNPDQNNWDNMSGHQDGWVPGHRYPNSRGFQGNNRNFLPNYNNCAQPQGPQGQLMYSGGDQHMPFQGQVPGHGHTQQYPGKHQPPRYTMRHGDNFSNRNEQQYDSSSTGRRQDQHWKQNRRQNQPFRGRQEYRQRPGDSETVEDPHEFVPKHTATVPTEIFNLNTIQIQGADDSFNKFFQRILDTHPERDSLLLELEKFPVVQMEKQSPSHSLSVEAPPFQSRQVKEVQASEMQASQLSSQQRSSIEQHSAQTSKIPVVSLASPEIPPFASRPTPYFNRADSQKKIEDNSQQTSYSHKIHSVTNVQHTTNSYRNSHAVTDTQSSSNQSKIEAQHTAISDKKKPHSATDLPPSFKQSESDAQNSISERQKTVTDVLSSSERSEIEAHRSSNSPRRESRSGGIAQKTTSSRWDKPSGSEMSSCSETVEEGASGEKSTDLGQQDSWYEDMKKEDEAKAATANQENRGAWRNKVMDREDRTETAPANQENTGYAWRNEMDRENQAEIAPPNQENRGQGYEEHNRRRNYRENQAEIAPPNQENRGQANEEHNWRRNNNGRNENNDRNARYNDYPGRNDNRKYKKVTEKSGDLFDAPQDHSLAHCVAVDLAMGSGIAVRFRKEFKCVGELKDQRKRVGEVAVLEHEGRFVYYLITKKVSTGKPCLDDLKKSLQELKEHCVQHGVKNLAMPRIGCGLDKLEWRDVKPAIEDIFSDVDISITVYNLNSDDGYNNPRPKVKLYDRAHPLVDMEKQTGLVFFGAVDSSIDAAGNSLDKKFNFLPDYRKTSKQVGDVLQFIKKEEYLYGLVIREKRSDRFSYASFEKCLTELKKKARADKTVYLGFQTFCDENDDLTMEKIKTLVKHVFFSVEIEIYFCHPQESGYSLEADETEAGKMNVETSQKSSVTNIEDEIDPKVVAEGDTVKKNPKGIAKNATLVDNKNDSQTTRGANKKGKREKNPKSNNQRKDTKK